MTRKKSPLRIYTAASDAQSLCAKCKPYGKCVFFSSQSERAELLSQRKETELFSQSKGTEVLYYPAAVLEKIKKNNSPLTDRQISHWVNIRTDVKETNAALGKKLQQAHDLFHQNEYEQASYLYLDVFQSMHDCLEAWKGICAGNYFLGNYEDAVCASTYFPGYQVDNFVERFATLCELKVKERNAVFSEIEIEPENTSLLTNLLIRNKQKPTYRI